MANILRVRIESGTLFSSVQVNRQYNLETETIVSVVTDLIGWLRLFALAPGIRLEMEPPEGLEDIREPQLGGHGRDHYEPKP